jgi:hypothetical protein
MGFLSLIYKLMNFWRNISIFNIEVSLIHIKSSHGVIILGI